MLRGASSKGHMQREGEGAVVRQGQLIALVVAFLIGCAVVLMAGASGVQAEASNKEEARCEGTRKINVNLPARFTTNDLPGCPQGGLLLGTDKPDRLWPERKAMTRYAALAVKTKSGGDLATTSSTVV